jgi:hypothetical protein
VNITTINILEKGVAKRLHRTERNGEKNCRSVRGTLLDELMSSPPFFFNCRYALVGPV